MDLIPVPIGAQWGYLDRSGNVAIPPRFTFAKPFSEGLAVVNVGGMMGFQGDIVGGKWGYIDSAGSYAFPAQFDEASDFCEGLAAVNLGARTGYAAHEDGYYSTGGMCGYIDLQGAWSIPLSYELALPMREGFAAVSKGGKTGYIDATGRYAIQPNYNSGYSFHEGFALVSVDWKYGLIGRNGQFLLDPQFSVARHFSEGLTCGLVEDGYRYIFYDTTGVEACRAPEGTINVGNFSHGLCYAASGELQRFHDGKVYPRGRNKNYGYLDRSGNWSIGPQYDWASDFSEGLAWVRLANAQHMYIRCDGSPLNEKIYREAGSFRDGLALVLDGQKQALIDSNGSTFWEE